MKNREPFWTENPMNFAQNRIDSRQYIMLPEIAKAISKIGAKSILDYGCGEGHLSNHLVDKSNHIGLYDISDFMLNLAKKNVVNNGFNNISVHHSSEEIPKYSFDCVVLSLVLMTIGDDDEYHKILSDCDNSMKKDGTLIIGLTHPCFRQFLFSTQHTVYTLNKQFEYFKDNEPFDVYLRTSKSEQLIEFKDFHHSLTYTFSKIKAAGFVVENFVELKDQSIENSYYNHYFPPYLMIECKKKIR